MVWGTVLELNRDGARRARSLQLRRLFRGITTTVQMRRRGNRERVVPTIQTRLCIIKMTGSAGVEGDLIRIMEVNGFYELVTVQVTFCEPLV